MSHTPHFSHSSAIRGWAPTVAEIDGLAQLFDEIVHVALLHKGSPPQSTLPYEAENVRLRLLPASGGQGLVAKLGLIRVAPIYVVAIWSEMRRGDVIHIRAPAFVSLIALLVSMIRRKPTPRWVKYAGNWGPTSHEPLSYRIQRWMLRRNLARSPVTVNGHWPSQPKHVVSFPNPCLTRTELSARSDEIRSSDDLKAPQILFVGRLDESKGVLRAIRIIALLKDRGLAASLRVVGDGPSRRIAQQLAEQLGVDQRIRFLGWVPRPSLPAHYEWAHFILLPSASEGFPKVLAEAMARGVIPIASRVGAIPSTLETIGVGKMAEATDLEGFARHISDFSLDPAAWQAQSAIARESSDYFSYEYYLELVEDMLNKCWHLDVGRSNRKRLGSPDQ